MLVETARAKINLTLEVLGKRPDGYHELHSLVAFAEAGDRLELTAADQWTFHCHGPAAGHITGENLIDRAFMAVRGMWSSAAPGHVDLYKELPVAGGIGGGSADAAACLRLLRRLNMDRDGAPDWNELGRSIGADVPVCLVNRLAYMQGTGERVTPYAPPTWFNAVLVNPRIPLSTAAVFAELAASPLAPGFVSPTLREFASAQALLAYIAASRNDLEPPALRLAPVISTVQAMLQIQPGCQLVRLSGSGPTCFGLFESPAAAQSAAQAISRGQPNWWVRATLLA